MFVGRPRYESNRIFIFGAIPTGLLGSSPQSWRGTDEVRSILMIFFPSRSTHVYQCAKYEDAPDLSTAFIDEHVDRCSGSSMNVFSEISTMPTPTSPTFHVLRVELDPIQTIPFSALRVDFQADGGF